MLTCWALIFFLINGCYSSSDWSYKGSTGPSHWPGECRTGHRQSPINIEQVQPWIFGKFLLKNYEIPPVSTSATNNGHTAKINLVSKPGKEIQLSGGGLCPACEICTFNFAEIHFHWGSSSTQGSEHLVNGKAYPLEAHLVHYNDKYPNLTIAATKPDGLAVLGVLFHLQSENNPKWDVLTEALEKSASKELKQKVSFREPIPISTFLPQNTTSFYRYLGSLTTPNCMESVTWTVFTDTLGISEKQLSYFRNLKTADKEQLADNFRPAQPLNGREVYLAVKEGTTIKPSSAVTEPDWCKTIPALLGKVACHNAGVLLCPVSCYDIISASQPK